MPPITPLETNHPMGIYWTKLAWKEDVDCQTGPKISEDLAKKVEFKWKIQLTLDQLKEKSKNLLVPEKCLKLSVPLTNKDVFSRLNNTQKKGDLHFRNLQMNIQKASIALVQVTNNLLQDKKETKAMIKFNLDAISLTGHSLQHTSTMTRQKVKPFLNRTCASLFGKT